MSSNQTKWGEKKHSIIIYGEKRQSILVNIYRKVRTTEASKNAAKVSEL